MIIYAGGIPVFVDIEKDRFYNSFENIKKNIKKTACILITHLIDVNKDIDKLHQFTKKNNIYLIEDCAISFGAKNLYNKLSGAHSDFGILSFQALKNVQSLNGGCILSNVEKFNSWFKKFTKGKKDQSLIFLLKKIFFYKLVDFFTQTKCINFIFFTLLKFGYKNNTKFILDFIRADNSPKLDKIIPNFTLKIFPILRQDLY